MLKKEVKLLLLGAGESGKSTFLKQMRIIHGSSFSDEVLVEFREVIFNNIIRGMKVLIDARDKLGIPWADPDNEQCAQLVFSADNNIHWTIESFGSYSVSVYNLWQDSAIKQSYDLRSQFFLSDGLSYLFDNLRRISSSSYIPTHQDILHARKATKAITEYCVMIQGVPFRFVDVGGQRSQRQKWFQCFDSVTSIIFFVASSEYDQILVEDQTTNRLLESLNIFDSIINNRCFVSVSMILFLNKSDILEEKIERVKELFVRRLESQIDSEQNSPTSSYSIGEITEYLSDFKGDPCSLKDVQEFMAKMFESVRRDKHKPMFTHCTTAVDTQNIKYVFEAVRTTILRKNITALMLQ